MQKLILIGGGGHCKSCIDIIELENKYKIIGIIDVKEKIGQNILGYQVIDCDENLSKYISDDTYFLITIGQINSAKARIDLFNKIKSLGGKFATVISPRAYLAKGATIGEGSIVMHDALINTEASIGKNCIINTKSLIEHECIVENNCHIAIGAVLAGQVQIGANSFVGANSTIVQNTKVPPETFIKASSLKQ
jgi:sugar O-acyltransferase (sialic acid O-acetyltransferase NeuD family)